jgi:excisionase family DNA binding protein
MALMKKSELAQKLGVSRAYISKLIKEGKLKE